MIDAPLLALTRRRTSASSDASDAAAASENMRQLVQLRWIAVAGQLFTILTIQFGLGVELPLAAMFGVVGVLAVANLVVAALLSRRQIGKSAILAALLFDVGALTAQLFLSGGAGNPFISLYLLQVVLGAILLEAWSVWVLVIATSLCYAGLTAWSLPLVYPTGLVSKIGTLYQWGAWTSFALNGLLLALFITRITRNLRARDENLANFRQQVAEEDGIMRMGLFASGAAHELSTPLSSLAVILNDWGHMSLFTANAGLAGELGEMQAELERCKAIVTDILQSAGEPRGEALESTLAEAYLEEVACTWREVRPLVQFESRYRNVDTVAVITSPALRQAIWSLLDNAVEAGASELLLLATRTSDELVITISDDGPGFSNAQLSSLGKPHQSSKGGGHGLGLFLAASVSRRLGGRLEASNGPTRGAMVRLILPLAGDRPQER
jgi:two-component system sensor histidine kinase RegB